MESGLLGALFGFCVALGSILLANCLIKRKVPLYLWKRYVISLSGRMGVFIALAIALNFMPNSPNIFDKDVFFISFVVALFVTSIVLLWITLVYLGKQDLGSPGRSFKNLVFFLVLVSLSSIYPATPSGGPSYDMNEVIQHHMVDAPLWKLELYGIDLSITKRVVMMWVGSLLLLVILIPVARKIAKNPYKAPSRFGALIESLVEFVRRDIAQQGIGEHSHPYEPLLLTFFFFILTLNLLGLVPPLGELFQFVGEWLGLLAHGEHHDSLALPILVKLWPGITATGDISVTAALAGLVFLVILGTGFAYQGIMFVRNIVPSGVHWSLFPLMWVIEAAGLLTKPFALAIRLLANMTAGHLIILVLLGFIFQFRSWGIVPVSILGAGAIYLLEIFVAFLQAYIFTFLAALFIGGVQHRH
ncbi:MAG: F0F1 ATP synthase subunit A [Leptospiraceae bacterium]|nr:F0F1 ATP synthase subunit A [Leptospiraceae bacterium]MDW8306031.1 F0F1 ATP synthase subunit A [Leptospiraceae bacterium]